ncbi:G2/mitotic-specific cyclin [Tieghemiomyces parasiticus]|uniref:G2/mitotic-specific cyclin n=1 Tax=Tieghemiomyces parasiticus TaxID=78921 RepID=A0A9W7ZW19_9FUNG|nr:G2/mitotic-specific cyclin [Tieghemiomyces parasiticus]
MYGALTHSGPASFSRSTRISSRVSSRVASTTPGPACRSASAVHAANPLRITVPPPTRPLVITPGDTSPPARLADCDPLETMIMLDPEVAANLDQLERQTRPSLANMSQQPEIRWEFRGSLIDYVVSLHGKLRLQQDTLYLTVNLMDRYLSTRILHGTMLQLLVVACLWIASKLEERKQRVPRLEELVYAGSGAYDRPQLKRMEVEVMDTLKYALRHPSPELFLQRRALVAGEADLTLNVARYLIEHSLYDVAFLAYLPSTVADAALTLARSLLGVYGGDRVAAVSEPDPDLRACAAQLRARIPSVSTVLHTKYSTAAFSEASIIVGYCVGVDLSPSNCSSPTSSLPSSPCVSVTTPSPLAASTQSVSSDRSGCVDYKENLSDFYVQHAGTGPSTTVTCSESSSSSPPHPHRNDVDPASAATGIDLPSWGYQHPTQVISPPEYAAGAPHYSAFPGPHLPASHGAGPFHHSPSRSGYAPPALPGPSSATHAAPRDQQPSSSATTSYSTATTNAPQSSAVAPAYHPAYHAPAGRTDYGGAVYYYPFAHPHSLPPPSYAYAPYHQLPTVGGPPSEHMGPGATVYPFTPGYGYHVPYAPPPPPPMSDWSAPTPTAATPYPGPWGPNPYPAPHSGSSTHSETTVHTNHTPATMHPTGGLSSHYHPYSVAAAASAYHPPQPGYGKPPMTTTLPPFHPSVYHPGNYPPYASGPSNYA